MAWLTKEAPVTIPALEKPFEVSLEETRFEEELGIAVLMIKFGLPISLEGGYDNLHTVQGSGLNPSPRFSQQWDTDPTIAPPAEGEICAVSVQIECELPGGTILLFRIRAPGREKNVLYLPFHLIQFIDITDRGVEYSIETKEKL